MSGLETAIKDLVSRLETVTSRLEKVEGQLATGGGSSSSASSSSGSAPAGAGAAWVDEYKTLVADSIPKLVEVTNKFGDDILKQQVAAFQSACNNTADVLNAASNSKKPSPEVLAKLLAPVSEFVTKVVSIRDSNRGHKLWNHLSCLSEFAPAFGWLQVEPTPGPWVKEYTGNSQFYSNKLLREHKNKDTQEDKDQVAWVAAMNAYANGLQAYIKKHHTTNVAWNPRGGDAASFVGKSSGAATAAAPAPKKKVVVKKAAGGAGNLFAELNKGTAVTTGLKKVTKDMKTKYRKDKTSVVPAATAAKKAPSKFGATKRGTPKFELNGNKWVVDFQLDEQLEISDTIPKHTVYIYKCEKTTIKVSGKVNNITLDGCKKCGVVFDNVIASVEFVNCSGCEVQAVGKVPNFAIDKCSSIQVILSKECLNAEIVSSKSDQLNVVLPAEDDKSDPIELNIPEQFKTVVKGRTLETSQVEHV